jgi:hypothetical protein
MDMVLYALLKGKIDEHTLSSTSKVDKVGDYEIRIVDSIPEVRNENYIYIVTRAVKPKDTMVVGGKGVECILCGNTMIGLGVLNGNTFFDGYDYLYNIVRQDFTTIDGYISSDKTKSSQIKSMSLTGRSVIEDNVIKISQVNSIVVGDATIELNKVLCSLPNGVTDTIDLIKGKYSCKVCKDVLDSRIKWRYVATYSGYSEFVISGYSSARPEFLTNSSLLNTSVVETITEDNMIASSGFVASTPSNVSGKECIFVSNGVVKIRISSSRLSATTATALQEYLKNNPITILMQRASEVTEEIDVPILMANDGTTTITMSKEEGYLYPELTVELPLDQTLLV